MAVHQIGRQTEFAAEHPHLVLEQLAQGLDQLHLHARRQAADIVVALNLTSTLGLRSLNPKGGVRDIPSNPEQGDACAHMFSSITAVLKDRG